MTEKAHSTRDLAGLRVVSFESRRAVEMARLVERYGGRVIAAPCMQEVPVGLSEDVRAFGEALLAGEVDVVVFLTGVGARVLAKSLEARIAKERWPELFAKPLVAARGPKASGALRELGVRSDVNADDPHLSATLVDVIANARDLRGARTWVQEYGAPNHAFVQALQARGASVRTVTPYVWKLPEDTTALRDALASIERGEADVTLFLSAPEIDHVLEFAESIGRRAETLSALRRTVVAAVGPSCRDRLEARGLPVDVMPEHSKMGPLVQAVAERAHELLREKRR